MFVFKISYFYLNCYSFVLFFDIKIIDIGSLDGKNMILKLKGYYKMWGLVKLILNKWVLYVKFV